MPKITKIECTSFGEIINATQRYIDEHTLVVSDIDGVLSVQDNPVHSHFQFAEHKSVLDELFGHPPTQKEIDIFFAFLVNSTKNVVVESTSISFLQDLQKRNIKTVGLTSSITGNLEIAGISQDICDYRIARLLALGYNFDPTSELPERIMTDVAPYLHSYPTLRGGIMFTNGEYLPNGAPAKGKNLINLLTILQNQIVPKRIVFIDDRDHNVQSVLDALALVKDREIEAIGIHYTGALSTKQDVDSVLVRNHWKPIVDKVLAISKQISSRAFDAAHMSFTPVHLRKEPLTLQDLLISEERLVEYLELFDFPVQEIDRFAQLSPIGLALIAGSYNDKGDQSCSIYVASLNNDLISIIQQVNSSADGTKCVVIFQPTDGTCKELFHTIHKTVVYLEKKYNVLHVVHADSVHILDMENYVEILARQALPNVQFAFYKREPILHPDDKSFLHLQVSYVQCGTHALRLARKIAKSTNFLDGLICIESDDQHDAKVRVLRYQMPIIFAGNASSGVMRKQLLTMYEGHVDRTKLAEHFDKYKEKGSYGCKFSEKYVAMVQSLLSETSPDGLLAKIDNTNAKNFRL